MNCGASFQQQHSTDQYIESLYQYLENLCLRYSAPHNGGQDFHPSGPSFIMIRALEARLETLNSSGLYGHAVNAFYDLYDSEKNLPKMILGLTRIVQEVQQPQGWSVSATQALALFSRVADLSDGGCNSLAVGVFEELFVHVRDYERLVRLLMRVIYQMEQYGNRRGPSWSEQSPEEEQLGALFGELTV